MIKTDLRNHELEEHKQILSILDESEMTPKHYWLWFIASGGTLLDGISIMMIGITLHLMSDKLSALMIGLIGASLVLGAVFGSNLGGKLGDTFGRKKLLIANIFCILVGSVISTISFSPWVLLLGQLIIGAGIGSDFASSSSYVAEIIPRKKRSRLMVGMITFQSIGLLFAGVLALAVLYGLGSDNVWRYLFAIEVLIALLFLLFRLSLIESPRWLMGQGKNNKACTNLAKLYPDKVVQLKKLGERAGNDKHSVILPPSKQNVSSGKSYSLLFSKEYINRTILVSLPWFLMDIATYGVGLFTSVILASVIKPSASDSLYIKEIHNVFGTTAIDTFLLLGFLLALWLVPKLGKIKAQSFGFAGMFIGMMLLFLDTFYDLSGNWHTVLIFSGFIIFNLSMNAGPNATTFSLAPELFPTQLRSTASGFAKVGATLGIFIFPILKEKLGVDFILLGVSLISLVALLITAIYAEKIKEGKSLESFHRH